MAPIRWLTPVTSAFQRLRNRLVGRYGVSYKNQYGWAAEALGKANPTLAEIEESDRQRREYLRRFYSVGRELPTHYDLVVNTDALTTPLATRLIVSAAKG